MEEHKDSLIEELKSDLSTQNGEIKKLKEAIANGKHRSVFQAVVCGAIYFILSLIAWFILDIPSIRSAISTLFPATELTGTVLSILLGGIGASTAIGVLIRLGVKDSSVKKDLEKYKDEFERIEQRHQDRFNNFQTDLHQRLELIDDKMNLLKMYTNGGNDVSLDKQQKPTAHPLTFAEEDDNKEKEDTNVINPPISVDIIITDADKKKKETIIEKKDFSFKPSYK